MNSRLLKMLVVALSINASSSLFSSEPEPGRDNPKPAAPDVVLVSPNPTDAKRIAETRTAKFLKSAKECASKSWQSIKNNPGKTTVVVVGIIGGAVAIYKRKAIKDFGSKALDYVKNINYKDNANALKNRFTSLFSRKAAPAVAAAVVAPVAAPVVAPVVVAPAPVPAAGTIASIVPANPNLPDMPDGE